MIFLQSVINTNNSYNTQEGSNTLFTEMIHLTTNTNTFKTSPNNDYPLEHACHSYNLTNT